MCWSALNPRSGKPIWWWIDGGSQSRRLLLDFGHDDGAGRLGERPLARGKVIFNQQPNDCRQNQGENFCDPIVGQVQFHAMVWQIGR